MDKLFDTKRKYFGSDGDEYINFSIPAVDINKISGYTTVQVNQDENGRLDNVVWQKIAKNMDMIDIVMYANHIFNPFAVKDGDILYVPIDNDKVYVSTAEPKLIDGTKHSDNSRGVKTKTYAEKVAYLAKQGLGVK